MFIGKKYRLDTMLRWSFRYIFYFLIIDAIPVVLYEVFDFKWLMLPWQPLSLIGIAVAFYLGFKNNSSYERLWEARKIWGGIVNASRTFTVMSRDFITNDHATEKLDESELASQRKTMVHRHVAWLHALTYQLRVLKKWEHNNDQENEMRKMGDVHPEDDHFVKIKPYLSESDYAYIMSKGNRASHLLSLQSKHLLELKQKGLIEDFRHMELANMLKEFYALQGKSERIKNFPFPRQYATVNHYFVWLFILILPFGMLNIFGSFSMPHMIWLAIPMTMIVSWVFMLMEMIGDYSENPFEGLYNDVPINSMARSIEIDIRQMLDETDLPKPVEPIWNDTILL